MKLKVYVTLVKSMPGWHRVFSASSLDVPELCRGACCDRDTSVPFASVIVWRNRGEVSTSPISHQSQSLGKIKTFAHVWQSLVICCALNSMVTWWSERHGYMVWHYITLTKPSDFLWKIAFECYDGLYQIVLQDSWLVQTATPMMSFIWKEGHFSEIHRSIAQAQRKQISNELFLCLHNPLLRKVLNDFRRYSLCGFTPEFQNQFTSQLTPTLAERHY